MQMSDADLASFRLRCIQAAQQGFLVARADEYMEALEAEGGSVEPPMGTTKGSAAHLAEMASAAMEARAGGGKKKTVKKPAEPPPKSSPKAAAPAKKKVEEIVPVSYDTWSYDELYAEAQKREIPNRSKMTKEELVAVLEADDEENAK